MSSSPCRRRNSRAAILGLLLLAVPSSVRAQTFAEVRSQIDQLRRSGGVELSRQESILTALERWSKQFYRLVEQGNDVAARALFGELHPLLKDLYEYDHARTDALVQSTIKADGDLEATQASPEFHDAEIARLRALYNLSWVSSLGATLLPAEDRRRVNLLEFAVEGFGEFVIGPDASIARECLLGRGQALKALGRGDQALADFRRLIELGPSSPQYAPARTAAVEALLGAGRAEDAAREASALIADATAGTVPGAGTQARLLRAQALLLSLKQGSAPSVQRSARLREAMSLLREVERAGGSWPRKAQAVASWGVAGLPEAELAAGTGLASVAVAQSLMLSGKHAEALTQLEAAIGNAVTPPNERTAAHFQAGLAAFRLERYGSAAKHLRAFLDAAPRDADAPEAAYLLFKSLEAVARAQPSPAAEAAYRQALRTFLDGAPDHPASAEARFRLAEILREEGDVLGAAREFRRVKGNRTLEFYAEFNAAQAMFGRIHAPPEDVAADEIETERRSTLVDLERFLRRLDPARNDPALAATASDLAAKATVMAAILATEGSDPDYRKALEFTSQFVKRFPEKPDLARQALAIEMVALQKAGDPERAEQTVSAYVETFVGNARARRSLLKRLGREFYVQAEADRAAHRPEIAAASARIAIVIYRRLLSELGDTSQATNARRGVLSMLGSLYRLTGDDGEASAAYVAVLDIDPRSEEALKGLAEIAGRTGNHEKAARYWELLSGLIDPKDPDWIEARFAAATAAGAAGDRAAGCRFVRETETRSPYPLVGADKARFGELERRLCGS